MNIDTSGLPGNSNMQKAALVRKEKSKESVISSSNHITAKGRIRDTKTKPKLTDIFVKTDIQDIIYGVIGTVFIPRMQNLIVEVVNGVARAVFLGETVELSRSSRIDVKKHTDYTGFSPSYKKIKSQSSPIRTTPSRGSNNKFDEIVWDTYGEAKIVLDTLDEIMQEQEIVTVSDLYNEAGVTCPFTGDYLGWTDISSAKIVTDGNVYWIKLPPAKEITD